MIGVGRNADAAFRPFLTSVRGTDVAVLAATTKPDSTARAWAAGDRRPGWRWPCRPHPRLLSSVRKAAARRTSSSCTCTGATREQGCPTDSQRRFARALADAGADIVLGSHAHVLLGAGWLGSTYVDYGLGNFLWYHQTRRDRRPAAPVQDGEVVGDSWVPAVHTAVGPEVLPRAARAEAVRSWRSLRGCTGLAAARGN